MSFDSDIRDEFFCLEYRSLLFLNLKNLENLAYLID